MSKCNRYDETCQCSECTADRSPTFDGLTKAQTQALIDIGNGLHDNVRSGPHLARLASLSLIVRTGSNGSYGLTETAKYWMLGQCAKWNAQQSTVR